MIVDSATNPLIRLREIMGKATTEAFEASSLRAIVASKRVADFVVSEGAVEAVARVIAYELGDTMGDSRGVFWSAQGRAAKEGWKDAARAALAEIASAGVTDHG